MRPTGLKPDPSIHSHLKFDNEAGGRLAREKVSGQTLEGNEARPITSGPVESAQGK